MKAMTKPAKAACPWSGFAASFFDEASAAGAASLVASANSAEGVTAVKDCVLLPLPLSWNIPPNVADAKVVLDARVDDGIELLVAMLLVVEDELLELLEELEELEELDELGELDELDELLLVLVLEVASVESGVELEDVVATAILAFFGAWDVVADSSEDDELDESPVEPSVLKTTMFAVDPFGTVTTQKSAPPAPEAEVALLTTPKPSELGSMAQGRPLQFPSHSTFKPKEGLTPWKESVYMGL